MRNELKLENIRSNLIRQEETIIFSLIERAQFAQNLKIYKNGGVKIPDYNGSFLMFLLEKMENVYSQVRRYTSPDEHPFTSELISPVLEGAFYNWPIKKNNININDKILKIYLETIIPKICKEGDDHNYGSSAVTDIAVLEALSKRIHYGKFVAESKYLTDEDGYKVLIKNDDKDGIMEKLTNIEVEKKILKRVELKASTYGQEPDAVNPDFKVNPSVIKDLYFKFIIPLTKEVEYLYLIERL